MLLPGVPRHWRTGWQLGSTRHLRGKQKQESGNPRRRRREAGPGTETQACRRRVALITVATEHLTPREEDH